jgi:hypothetical protein
MRIFAKRSKNKAVPTISEADKAIQELLKKDPKDLNAKERRQIKRYHDRNGATSDTNSTSIKEEEIKEDSKSEKELIENCNHLQVDYSESSKLDGSLSGQTPGITPNNEISTLDVKDDEESEVRDMLEKLNSKNKRKLTRQLDRDGIDALQLVREEAIKLLSEQKTKEEAIHVARESKKAVVTTKTESASKKRKREEWNSLSPEERLRREDQRRKQQEAAERRVKGDIPSTQFKHPLNSERRRANRRKPKWQKKVDSTKIDHHTSGFSIRKSSSRTNS